MINYSPNITKNLSDSICMNSPDFLSIADDDWIINYMYLLIY